jgi:hypothetical protein
VAANGKLTVQEIMDRVRRSFGDESAVQIETADIYRWINDACREAVMQHENLLQTSAKMDSVVGQYTYDLPADCFSVNAILYRDSSDVNASFYHLRYVSQPQLTQWADGWQGTDYGTGTPQLFARGDANTFLIWPPPDTARVNGLELIYGRYALEVATLVDAIDLPAYYHSYVEHFCMMKAYEMDEDWESADRKAQLIQSTLNFNNSRESWFGRETYPVITSPYEDM